MRTFLGDRLAGTNPDEETCVRTAKLFEIAALILSKIQISVHWVCGKDAIQNKGVFAIYAKR